MYCFWEYEERVEGKNFFQNGFGFVLGILLRSFVLLLEVVIGFYYWMLSIMMV